MAELIVIMGPTGAGKGVQSDLIAAERGGVHLSSGALLRRDAQMAASLNTGHLAPTAEVNRVVAEAVQQVPANQLVILDGFPRQLSQAKWLDARLGEWGRTLKRVILLDATEAETRRRLLTRGRSDDNHAAIDEKWREYQTETLPVLAHYEQLGLLARVNGHGTPDEVAARIREVLA